MADKKGTGILVVSLYGVAPDKEAEFNDWYNGEHMGQAIKVPGFLNGGRYVPVAAGPQHLTFYELESPDTVNHPGLVALRTTPRWNYVQDLGGWGVLNHVYRQIFPAQVSPEAAQAGMAQYLAIEVMDVPSEVEDEFNDWYIKEYIPLLEKEPGVIRARRYFVARGRNNEAPKEPRYANVYELKDEKAYVRARSAAENFAEPRMRDMLSKIQYARDFPCVMRKHYQPEIPN